MTDTQATDAPAVETGTRRATGISRALNRYFHHLDRGGSLGGEVAAGLISFFLSICLLFVNVQVIASRLVGDVELVNAPATPANIEAAQTYAELYVGAVLTAFLGTLLIGILARLPFTQLSTLGLTGSLFSLVGASSGLTYQNLLFINLLAAVVYVLIVAVGPLRRFVVGAIPHPVRKALPAALGLILVIIAIQLGGIVTTSTTAVTASGSLAVTVPSGVGELTGAGAPTSFALIGIAVAVLIYALSRALKWKHAVSWAFLAGTAVYAGATILVDGTDVSDTDSFLNFGRIWFVASSQASPATPFGDSYLSYGPDAIGAVLGNLGDVLTTGLDFSAYSGNALGVLLAGVLGYLLVALFDAQGTVQAASNSIADHADRDGRALKRETTSVFLANAVTNLVAPFLGAGAVRTSTTSFASLDDNGKSGIASIVASLGLLLSLFVTAFPALLATAIYPVESMNKWNYNAYGNGGFVFLFQGLAFGIVYAVVLCVGVAVLVRALRTIAWSKPGEAVPALLTVVAAGLFTSIVVGVGVGLLAAVILRSETPRSDEEAVSAVAGSRRFPLGTVVLLAVVGLAVAANLL